MQLVTGKRVEPTKWYSTDWFVSSYADKSLELSSITAGPNMLIYYGQYMMRGTTPVYDFAFRADSGKGK